MKIIDDIIALVGKETDLSAKYEGNVKPDEEGNIGILTELDDHDSLEITGEKLATLANFAADKTKNEIIEELKDKLPTMIAAYHSSVEGYYRTLVASAIDGIFTDINGEIVITITEAAIEQAQGKHIQAKYDNNVLVVLATDKPRE